MHISPYQECLEGCWSLGYPLKESIVNSPLEKPLLPITPLPIVKSVWNDIKVFIWNVQGVEAIYIIHKTHRKLKSREIVIVDNIYFSCEIVLKFYNGILQEWV